jgi:hypothetical protein
MPNPQPTPGPQPPMAPKPSPLPTAPSAPWISTNGDDGNPASWRASAGSPPSGPKSGGAGALLSVEPFKTLAGQGGDRLGQWAAPGVKDLGRGFKSDPVLTLAGGAVAVAGGLGIAWSQVTDKNIADNKAGLFTMNTGDRAKTLFGLGSSLLSTGANALVKWAAPGVANTVGPFELNVTTTVFDPRPTPPGPPKAPDPNNPAPIPDNPTDPLTNSVWNTLPVPSELFHLGIKGTLPF